MKPDGMCWVRKAWLFIIAMTLSVIALGMLTATGIATIVFLRTTYCWESSAEGKTRGNELAILIAISSYYADYGCMPKANDRDMIAALREDRLRPPGKRKAYLQIPPEEIKDGLVIDGWGNPLIIHLDHQRKEIRIKSSHENAPMAFHSLENSTR